MKVELNEKETAALENVTARTRKKKVTEDEQQILSKANAQEPAVQEEEMSLDELIDEIKNEAATTKDVAWYQSVPKKERLLPGDVVYHEELERFGIMVRPAKKEGLMRIRLLKIGSKTEVYTRDWFLDFDDITLVKRGNSVKRGFAETDEEFLVRASRKKETAVSEGVH